MNSRKIKTVSFIGLGALGILFANHLAKRMPRENLRIIADKDRIARYKKDGVFCNGERCEFNYVSPQETTGSSDLLIFTVKYQALSEAIRAVKNQVGPDTIILSALNGITSEEIIAQAYGMDKVLYCVAQGMDAVKVGNHLKYHHAGMLCIGEREPGVISPKVQAVAEFFDSTEFPYEVETDMYRRLWGKFMLNVGINQTIAVYADTFGDIQKDGQARNTMIAAMREVMVLSEKEGINLTEADLSYWLDVISKLSPEGKPSMRQDVEAQRLTEVDLFAGTVLELGKKHGVATPVNQELYDQIKQLESVYH